MFRRQRRKERELLTMDEERAALKPATKQPAKISAPTQYTWGEKSREKEHLLVSQQSNADYNLESKAIVPYESLLEDKRSSKTALPRKEKEKEKEDQKYQARKSVKTSVEQEEPERKNGYNEDDHGKVIAAPVPAPIIIDDKDKSEKLEDRDCKKSKKDDKKRKESEKPVSEKKWSEKTENEKKQGQRKKNERKETEKREKEIVKRESVKPDGLIKKDDEETYKSVHDSVSVDKQSVNEAAKVKEDTYKSVKGDRQTPDDEQTADGDEKANEDASESVKNEKQSFNKQRADKEKFEQDNFESVRGENDSAEDGSMKTASADIKEVDAPDTEGAKTVQTGKDPAKTEDIEKMESGGKIEDGNISDVAAACVGLMAVGATTVSLMEAASSKKFEKFRKSENAGNQQIFQKVIVPY